MKYLESEEGSFAKSSRMGAWGGGALREEKLKLNPFYESLLVLQLSLVDPQGK